MKTRVKKFLKAQDETLEDINDFKSLKDDLQQDKEDKSKKKRGNKYLKKVAQLFS